MMCLSGEGKVVVSMTRSGAGRVKWGRNSNEVGNAIE